MDISEFSQDDFDAKAWVNAVLNSNVLDKQNDYVIGLAMKLQLYVQQVNKALENTSQQTLTMMPKIIRDTKALQEEAIILKEKMEQVKEDIIKIELDTTKSINSIEALDSIKNKLVLVKEGLQETDNWAILVNDLEEVFDSKNIENISNKILGMQNSLKLLVNVVDYEDRRLQLEGLKNRLEAIASPLIVQAFTSYNTEQAARYVHIFQLMGRLPELIKYYGKCEKDTLIKKWRDQLETELDGSVVQCMHNYYNVLISNWHTQVKWFTQVFTGECASSTLVDIYVMVLNSLDPSLSDCLQAAMKQVPDKLIFLKEVKEVTTQFSENMLEKTIGIEPTKIQNLLRAIFAHLVNYISNYAAYEQAHLNKQLGSINCMKEELSDTIQALGLSVSVIIDYARDAKKRCFEVTEQYGICGLLVALRAYFSNYSGYYRVALRQVDRSKRPEEDWSTFQLCLTLLQYSGDVLLKIQELEKDLTSTVLELNKKKDRVDLKHYVLSASALKEYDSLIRCVTEGTQLSLLDHVTNEFSKLCSDIHHTTYQVVFGPIASQLSVVQVPQTWSQYDESAMHNSDLPDYSFSPQEYITQIGQYLMTLPQHLEPFLFRENPSLMCALKSIDQEYATAANTEGALAQVFLKIVARGTCNNFCDKILSVCQLSHSASRQLAHDISYLNNVLQDLGISLSENLQQLSLLLKIPSDQYQSQSTSCSARYVAAVRQMRNITSN
ncbi:conserved oligomeric Golgi complex subunit 7 [Cylas formicarius]|uniref:conserved oligomeric Golgi complex subunit 7 n=1 Tax=Cylas formicarius TaxID=197179 RepID=UPI0029583FE0|nr:conserved oligomeric Golgi complex subunit 7 [Cylas formicarius]